MPLLRNFTPYSTAEGLISGSLPWIDGDDALRIQSYQLYEQIYWNVPDTFELIRRGSDAKPIYIPSGKEIVETIHRFTAPGLNFTADPNFGSDTERVEAMQTLTDLFRRERFVTKFNASKRFGIIRGDWFFYLRADSERQEGARISIMEMDPASYFPIYKEGDPDTVVGVHIVEGYREGDEDVIRRITYRKVTGEGGPSPITFEEAIFPLDEWGGPNQDESAIRVLTPPTALPAPIDSIPIYHIKNFVTPQDPFGSSELRGLERVIAAVNQGISDEEMILALEGLGVYVTDAGQPEDENGNLVPWNLGPGRVVELPEGRTFKRANGAGSMQPIQDHLNYLHRHLDLAAGTPNVAKGNIDVNVAESGVSLAIQMGPILARGGEKEDDITDTLTQMLFDLRKWIIAYEPTLRGPMEAIRWIPQYGPKLPMNRQERFKELMELASADPPIVPMSWVRDELRKIDYDFPEDTDVMGEILTEMQLVQQIKEDVTGARIDQEIDAANAPAPSPNGQPQEA